MGAYTVILRRTPDHEDLLTTTDSEVLCRLVGRWVGQGGKASLANTADAKPMEERHLEQDYPKRSKKGGGGISARRTTTVSSKQVEEGTV